MIITELESTLFTEDGNMCICTEQAKRVTIVDRSFTCFKGVGSVSKADAGKCMWLAEIKKNKEYI